jgi:hypothetical protein
MYSLYAMRYVSVCVYVRTYVHTYIHTYIHTYSLEQIRWLGKKTKKLGQQ